MLRIVVLLCAAAAWLNCLQCTHDNPVIYPSTSENDRARQIPESVLIQMKDIRNLSELLDFLGAPAIPGLGGPVSIPRPLSGEPTNEDDDNATIGERRKNSAVFDVSRAAGCEPELRTVELEKPTDPTHVYWPLCIRLPRCGGCCTSSLLECVTVRTTKVEAKAVHVQYTGGDLGGQFDVMGFKSFKMEKHEKCACRCRERAEHCNALQNYLADECRCVCANLEARDACEGTHWVWDHKECACKCREVGQCSTGFFFSEFNCRCESYRSSLIGNPNITLDSSESESNSTVIPTTSSSSSSQETTTTAPATSRPLLQIRSRLGRPPETESLRYKGQHVGIRPVDDGTYDGPFTLARSQQKNKTRRIVPSVTP